jgi:hypothetical protein
MKRTVFCVVLLVVVACSLEHRLAAQTPDIRVHDNRITYPVSATSLQAVDFRNIKYHLDDWVQLHDGKHQEKSEVGGMDVQLELLWFIDPWGGVPHALVYITDTQCGASCGVGGYVFVFEVAYGKLQQDQLIEFNKKEPRAGIELESALRTLTITSSEAEGACCAPYLEIEAFTWGNGKFQKTAYKHVPNDKPVPNGN